MKFPKLFLLPIFVSLSLLSGCRHYEPVTGLTYLTREESPGKNQPGMIQVHFLGTSGIYLRADGVSVLADPFFSNPYPIHLFSPFPVASDADLINRELQRLMPINPLQAVLVTHSHYDHAMDVPYIARHYAPVCVYGSETLRNSLEPVAKARFCSLMGKVHDPTQADAEWVTVSPRIRIAAIQASHFSHALGIMYAKGHYHDAPRDVPSRLYEWRLGETYSYVIDILSPVSNASIFRIFYLPSAATHPIGTPPSAILDDGKEVDLAIIGASQLEKDESYPGALLRRMQPKAVMMVHWENFFEKYRTRNLLLNYKVDPEEIARRIREAIGTAPDIYWPERGAVKSFVLPQSTTASVIAPRIATDHSQP